jgi:hypothetical protein
LYGAKLSGEIFQIGHGGCANLDCVEQNQTRRLDLMLYGKMTLSGLISSTSRRTERLHAMTTRAVRVVMFVMMAMLVVFEMFETKP